MSAMLSSLKHISYSMLDSMIVPAYIVSPSLGMALRSKHIERINAYHEAGHALMACHSAFKKSVLSISIVPDRGGRGKTLFAVKKAKYFSDEEKADWARVMYAGSIAEKFAHDFTTISFGGNSSDNFEASEVIKELPGKNSDLRKQFKCEAEEFLSAHREELDALAQAVIQGHTLSRKQIFDTLKIS